MSRQRLLLKVAAPSGRLAPAMPASPGIKLDPLFEVTEHRLGVASRTVTWVRAEATGATSFGATSAHPWDLAHSALRSGLGLSGAALLLAEPDLEQSWAAGPQAGPSPAISMRSSTCAVPEGELGFPYGKGRAFGWHLDDAYSGLRTARDQVGEAGASVTIVHLDTGYDPEHRALPRNLDLGRQRNFVEGDDSAVDLAPATGLFSNRGHGTGTLGVLAGGPLAGLRAEPAIPEGFGSLGGAPHARVVPVRIADSVVHFWTSGVAQGIDYARRIGADVVSMSMGGLPSAAWADAVNAAYEAGVVLVCAAGNSFGGLPTSLIVYPARFNRVIAACGVMANGNPYYGLGGPMEGCVGPASKMATAMAAYTPNIPWLRMGCPDVVDMDGAGTSSATPQIAAAAALWLAKHGDRYPRGWRRVEAVRRALFGSAGSGRGEAGPISPYFGRGLLRAAAALDIRPKPGDLVETKSDSASFAFLHLLSPVFGAAARDERQLEMLRLELTQLALSSRAFREAIPEPATKGEDIPSTAIRRALSAVLDEQTSSVTLKEYVGDFLGRSVNGGGPAGRPTAGPARPAPAQGAPLPRGGRDIPRLIAIPMPTRRRLRVFATDPGDSSTLDTSFVNVATVEVPWERLDPGPVGEYVEVVDVDPASDAAYPPVDLDDRSLLAQDGFAPSEGNPFFHQQMVYAVVMRTIRNFEIALGRKALWAERRMPSKDGRFVPAPDRGYVQRLRIYPHALRERNAYYSPERKALLFGYFGDTSGPSRGRRTVFTCLSHDVVAHETTHALLDGLHRRYQEATNPDVLAFHEAFADIVAIFQHFTFPELLRYEIARLRGDMSRASILSDLARQFGRALHNERALRRAIASVRREGESTRDPDDVGPPLPSYEATLEPHERGAILVAAVFEAFTAIYERRTQDLFRLATGGTGVLRPGAIHPDLVNRLADAAVEVAQRILTVAIRALDYMPPVDPTFADYLRAIVTADADLAPDHGLGYRVALAEAFARRGIFPRGVRSVSPDGLLWQAPAGPVQSARFNDFLRTLDLSWYTQSDRRMAFEKAKQNAASLHSWLAENIDVDMATSLGLDFTLVDKARRPLFEVHSVRPALRTTADGEHRVDVVAMVTQRRKVLIDPAGPSTGPTFIFRGGCTLLMDREFTSPPVRYAICRPIWNRDREERMRRHLSGHGATALNATYSGEGQSDREPFCGLHAAIHGG